MIAHYHYPYRSERRFVEATGANPLLHGECFRISLSAAKLKDKERPGFPPGLFSAIRRIYFMDATASENGIDFMNFLIDSKSILFSTSTGSLIVDSFILSRFHFRP